MNDYIKRQDVKDLIECNKDLDGNDAIVWIEKGLDDIPPVDIVVKSEWWIPVSEKEPDIGKYVLCSLINVHDIKHNVIICKYTHQEWWTNYVKAWMPLPEPYNVESEEN